jgi:hypothetical protein
MPFQKGHSGNPAGRPPGARCKATIIAETLLQGEAEALTRSAIERAMAGDMTALRMCLDRLAPPCRHRAVAFELPPLESAQDAAAALAAITAAVSAGELTPAEAADLFKLVDGFARLHEATILEQRVAKLERSAGTPACTKDAGDRTDRVPQIDQDTASLPPGFDPLGPYNFGDAP